MRNVGFYPLRCRVFEGCFDLEVEEWPLACAAFPFGRDLGELPDDAVLSPLSLNCPLFELKPRENEAGIANLSAGTADHIMGP